MVQTEPAEGESPEILGILASISIRKGEPFSPDARTQKLLTAAASAGSVSVKTIMSKPRDEMFYFYPGESYWMNPFPGIDNNKTCKIKNTDGSYDVYFGPKAPKGQENNWVHTIPGKGWSVILRLYGPLEPWYEKMWRPGEIELVK